MKTYKQLTYELRCQIYALKKIGLSQNEIARQLKVSQSTISRELSRRAIKMISNLIALIDSKVQVEWSPEQVSGWLREEHNIFISHETIYLYIWSDKKRGGHLSQHLRR